MRDLELDAAIAAEERDLLRQIGEEPGFFSQATSIFGDRLGWVSMVLLVTQTALFVLGCYAGWRFFAATETLDALHWGLPAATLILAAIILKMALWPVIQTNRILLAIKRLQLSRGVAKP